mmetsp:Transcript_42921/g.128227  ORF Transcript_42921/g.128227 Transcript_42921/m.128227 type:complete len:239 (+) Transcript_42921:178-894(+)
MQTAQLPRLLHGLHLTPSSLSQLSSIRPCQPESATALVSATRIWMPSGAISGAPTDERRRPRSHSAAGANVAEFTEPSEEPPASDCGVMGSSSLTSLPSPKLSQQLVSCTGSGADTAKWGTSAGACAASCCPAQETRDLRGTGNCAGGAVRRGMRTTLPRVAKMVVRRLDRGARAGGGPRVRGEASGEPDGDPGQGPCCMISSRSAGCENAKSFCTAAAAIATLPASAMASAASCRCW